MKTALIIIGLIFSFSLFGQYDWKQNVNLRKVARLEIYFTMREYIEDCYADSTLLYEDWTPVEQNSMENDSMFSFSEVWNVSYIYKHRQPTFEGYFKWFHEYLLIGRDSIHTFL